MDVSVREMIAFLYPRGSLGNLSPTWQKKLAEGSLLHKEIQKEANIQAEITLSHTCILDGVEISLHGRADQLYYLEQVPVIREIKTLSTPISDLTMDSFPNDWLQAMCYAFMLHSQKRYESCEIELYYIHLPKKDISRFNKAFLFDEIEKTCKNMLSAYIHWQKRICQWQEQRNRSISSAVFPFPSLRKGQKELLDHVSYCIHESSSLWAEAPTGIGKTMGVLFPAIQSMANKSIDKVFYLTSKTAQQIHVADTIQHLLNQGVRLRTIQITAKLKLCPLQQSSCDPTDCIYGMDYYHRLMDALNELLQDDLFTSKEACLVAEKYSLCPFEFLLDASLWADIIIGDYNYFFDPRVKLKRYWELSPPKAVVLVDEAHNLVDRSREMYSAQFSKKEIWNCMKLVKKSFPELYDSLKNTHRFMLLEQKEMPDRFANQMKVFEKFPQALEICLEEILEEINAIPEKASRGMLPKECSELYFSLSFMLKLTQNLKLKYFILFIQEKKDFSIRLYCIDASKELNESTKKSISSIFFSATLSPESYYQDILGGKKTDLTLKLESPFPRENLLTMTYSDISTRWKDRPASIEKITKLIGSVLVLKKGNYLVYFPSYQYLTDVAKQFSSQDENLELMIQTSKMKEAEKKAFIDAFTEENEKSLLAMAVLGGSFAEGIDLVGEKLHGVIIIGLGLPKICPERELIKNYYDETLDNGYPYAYLYPGLTKVMQAGGRVIRSEQDKGFILLVDDRFSYPYYEELLPLHWKPIQKLKTLDELKKSLNQFWK